MNRRNANARLLTFAALIIIAALLLFLGGRSGLFRPLVSVVMAPLSPLTGAANEGAQRVEELTGSPPSYDQLLERNRELESQLAQLQVEVAELREIERAYYRLTDIANYASQATDQTIVTADVIGRDSSSYRRSIIINAGTRSGIQVGNAVIAGSPSDDFRVGGFVGVVEEVSSTAAWVRLATDPASTVNAQMQNSRADGIVVGLLQGGLLMDVIPQEAVFEQGDIVLTSGLGGRLPANIVIGEVSNVRRQEAALFQQADITPVVNFDDLDIVGVIVTFQAVDTTIFDDLNNPEGTPAP